MLDQWVGRFVMVRSMEFVRNIPCTIPGLDLVVVDVQGKHGPPNGFHLLQVYTTAEPQQLIEAQSRSQLINPPLPFPKLVDAPAQAEGQVALLTQFDGVTWTRVKPLSQRLTDESASLTDLSALLDTLADLIGGWNDPRDVVQHRELVRPDAFLSPFLGPLPVSASNLLLHGRLIPNPYAYLKDAANWSNADQIFRFRGTCFGGVNVEHIYLHEDTPLMIDPRRLSLDSSFLFDWASLEISVLLDFFTLSSSSDWSAWLSLCRALSADLLPAVTEIPRGVAADTSQLIGRLRTKLQTWIGRVDPAFRSTMETSFWAMLLGAALWIGNSEQVQSAKRIAAIAYAALLFEQLAHDLRLPSLTDTSVALLNLPDAKDRAWFGAKPAAPVTYTSLPVLKRTAPLSPIKHRWALLVGINQYVDPNYPTLKYCVHDVEALDELLSATGYTTLMLVDNPDEERLKPTCDHVIYAIREILETADPLDFLWLHFSGHGQVIDGKRALITTEFRPLLKEKVLTLETIIDMLLAKHMRRVLITLDACHTGVEGWRGTLSPEFIQNVHELAEGYAVIAASTSQQKAMESGSNQHGVFTYYLLDALNGNADHDDKGFVTVDDLKTHVIDHLRRWKVKYGRIQEPTAKVSGIGDMIVVDHRKPAPK